MLYVYHWARGTVTDLTELLALKYLKAVPLLASQILTALSDDPDATRVLLGKKATDVSELLWPSSVCMQAPHYLSIAGLVVT
jgi:hypothetical protein